MRIIIKSIGVLIILIGLGALGIYSLNPTITGQSIHNPLETIIEAIPTPTETTPSNQTTAEKPKNPQTNQTIRIAAWNLHIFGQQKAQNQELMDSYTNIMNEYDLIIIQEIRDKSGEAFLTLCKQMENYTCTNTSRAGRSISKEQYGILYNENIQVQTLNDFNPDPEDRWERPPVELTITTQNETIILYSIHTKPSDTPAELRALEEIAVQEGIVIILGDLNADCTYYNAEKETTFDNWHWLINNSEDTTVGNSDCAYDRIIVNTPAQKIVTDSGILTEKITQQESDHYPIWIELNP